MKPTRADVVRILTKRLNALLAEKAAALCTQLEEARQAERRDYAIRRDKAIRQFCRRRKVARVIAALEQLGLPFRAIANQHSDGTWEVSLEIDRLPPARVLVSSSQAYLKKRQKRYDDQERIERELGLVRQQQSILSVGDRDEINDLIGQMLIDGDADLQAMIAALTSRALSMLAEKSQ